MIINFIVLDDGDDDDHDDDDDDGGDVQHAGVIPVNGIPSFPAPVRQPEHAQQAPAYHAHKQTHKNKCTQKNIGTQTTIIITITGSQSTNNKHMHIMQNKPFLG